MPNEEEFYETAFLDSYAGEPYNVPEVLKQAVIKICNAYNITGICDPMYIANVIARELGLGDGKSNFWRGDEK